MIVVKVKEGESFESAYRRFKRQCEKERLFSEVKKHERYEKPSEKKRTKRTQIRRK
ncbi:30S ribosomal protein S21 [candidate division WOR-3 bacterium]|nr:30S ribosomal protein S21 [candidate division WOR-3 bacterium]